MVILMPASRNQKVALIIRPFSKELTLYMINEAVAAIHHPYRFGLIQDGCYPSSYALDINLSSEDKEINLSIHLIRFTLSVTQIFVTQM